MIPKASTNIRNAVMSHASPGSLIAPRGSRVHLLTAPERKSNLLVSMAHASELVL
jgi:hypothetical protein